MPIVPPPLCLHPSLTQKKQRETPTAFAAAVVMSYHPILGEHQCQQKSTAVPLDSGTLYYRFEWYPYIPV